MEKLCGVVIHPLAQGCFRWNLRKTQSFTEKVIFPVLLDGRIIALPLSKQGTEGSDHIGMGNPVGQRNRLGNGRGEVRETVQGKSDQGDARG